MYKLLSNYPPERLLSVEVKMGDFAFGGVLSGVTTIRVPEAPRWMGPKGVALLEMSFIFLRPLWVYWLERRIAKFKPNSVVGVLHSWFSEVALAYARRHRLPFHAIIHDYHDVTFPTPKYLSWLCRWRWKRLCRLADTRSCVSPFMAEEVEKETGKMVEVLYPGLTPDGNLKLSRSARPRNAAEPMLFSFAGSIHPAYHAMIHRLGEILKAGDRLLIHSPQAITPTNNVLNAGVIPADRVAEKLAAEADVLFLPMSFRKEVKRNVRLCFPSKLVEYCAAGRPILIWAPPYSSAARWAYQNPGFAEVVSVDSNTALDWAVERLRDPKARSKMGERAADLARQFFSHDVTFAKFLHVVTAPAGGGNSLLTNTIV